MSAPAKCPGCGGKLQPDWENCPNCPLSFADEARPQTRHDGDGFRDFVVPVALFLVLGLGLWTMGSYVWDQVRMDSQSMALGKEGPRALVGGPPPAKNAGRRAAALPFAKTDEAGGPTLGPGGREDDASAVSIVPNVNASRNRPVREWKLRGVVYDLLTLKPVPGCAMTFTDNAANFRAQSVTNARGLYRIILPPLNGRGYLVAISKPGYAKSYLTPGAEGVALMDLASREELARELSATIAEPASLQPYAETPLVTDFHLAPKR